MTNTGGERPGETPEAKRTFGGRGAFLALGLAMAVLLAMVGYAVVSATRTTVPNNAAPSFPKLSAGRVAPAFSAMRFGGGQPVNLSAFRGRPIVVNFFASWCPNCRSELGTFAKISRTSGAAVQFLGVDSNDGDGTAIRGLIGRSGVTYPIALDPEASIANTYRIDALPVTFFLSSKGAVVGEAFGAQSAASLTRWVTELEHSTKAS